MKTPQPKKPRKPTERKDIPVETRKTGSGFTLRSWFSGLALRRMPSRHPPGGLARRIRLRASKKT